MYNPIDKEIFHVHTRRCRHAGKTKDHEYVDKAIKLGAKRITFTDHGPFPGDPFRNRMDMSELPEYISALKELRKRYEGRIEILIGLEIEYLPLFHQYYETLRETEELDLLMLGQHFYEHEPKRYSFEDEDRREEYKGLCEAMALGIETGFFDVVAHPDRVFRKRKHFGYSESEAAEKVINAASEYRDHPIYLERNLSSMWHKNHYRRKFWKMVPDSIPVIKGYDAHSTRELDLGWARFQKKDPVLKILLKCI